MSEIVWYAEEETRRKRDPVFRGKDANFFLRPSEGSKNRVKSPSVCSRF